MAGKHYHDIHIHKVARGFSVSVGCASLVYLDTDDEIGRLIDDFVDYVRDPDVKAEWFIQKFRQMEHGYVHTPLTNSTLGAEPERPYDG